MGSVRALTRRVAYSSGILGLEHRLLHRETLTVVMFHRVVSPGTCIGQNADPSYTLPLALFRECLRFFQRHYHVVGLETVRESLRGGPRLPPHSLLITFDDGWRDNVSVALPCLQQYGLPATIFVAANVLLETTSWWWQEILLRALRTGRASCDELLRLAGVQQHGPQEEELALLMCYGALDPAVRTRLLQPFANDAEAEGDHMVGFTELAELVASGVSIGGHGAAHLPLNMVAEPGKDINLTRTILEPVLRSLGQPLDAFSFPHGRYDSATVTAARAGGFSVLFTSDPCVNVAPSAAPNPLLGRISIDAGAITDHRGKFDPARMATWLFRRPIEALAQHES